LHQFNSTLTDLKNRPVFTLYPQGLPAGRQGNRPVFQLSPLGAGVKKLKNLI
jgi:hypothetical protein